ncbi:beta-ketoacyl synthase [Parapedobacter pyrenivorans]|uniref:Beta-ketoacyl synthase n=1 Tax=Parapedobacter pyrenivorans TaxID=1305674 RepID=A0A917HL28_9SPHI|nr:beta-ketoacyl synthase N-terminal-like domain-containing protein [Parapedobacter pyrenivorans]GGG82892.1 beta-ketoacyl synthase [Parapedobacter pyrenivorans]
MKDDVFIVGDEAITPLGLGSQLNFRHVVDGHTAVTEISDLQLADQPIYAARIDEAHWVGNIKDEHRYTRLEKLFILVLASLIAEYEIPLDERTLVVLATTKGNVSLLHNPLRTFAEERVHISTMTNEIQRYFGFKSQIIPLSNACISGSLAISVARRLLQYDTRYKRAIVIGGDELSKFIVSGFHAFQALADGHCRPFDRDRKGLNLGEAVAAVYLSKIPTNDAVWIAGVGSHNDANHISGPSRTGEGLYQSIQEAMQEAGEPALDFISAHGTATSYNDEMEAIALQRSGLSTTPLHSLKAYYGHTLGASGLLETILGIHSLKNNRLIPSRGFMHQGTSQRLNMITKSTQLPLNSFLKTASGFGGCNIATIFQKV